ncbi:hypothetical protein QQF64_011551 [Cirrhinus molitorella]|uniref:Uncharacterized protein n=1 Tax=Cirrhinus molitorella TaxID=172907 RepID=A0ABR3LZK2_9TELE
MEECPFGFVVYTGVSINHYLPDAKTGLDGGHTHPERTISGGEEDSEGVSLPWHWGISASLGAMRGGRLQTSCSTLAEVQQRLKRCVPLDFSHHGERHMCARTAHTHSQAQRQLARARAQTMFLTRRCRSCVFDKERNREINEKGREGEFGKRERERERERGEGTPVSQFSLVGHLTY